MQEYASKTSKVDRRGSHLRNGQVPDFLQLGVTRGLLVVSMTVHVGRGELLAAVFVAHLNIARGLRRRGRRVNALEGRR